MPHKSKTSVDAVHVPALASSLKSGASFFSLEKTLMLGKIEGRRKRGRQRMRWLDGITVSVDMSLSKLL